MGVAYRPAGIVFRETAAPLPSTDCLRFFSIMMVHLPFADVRVALARRVTCFS
jgi:hypothetical protein